MVFQSVLIGIVTLGVFGLAWYMYQARRNAATGLEPSGPQKHEIAAELAAELADNRLKCEMFVTVYSEKLHNMRDPARRASYEDMGDLVHRYPPLIREAFDRYQDHLHLLGPHIASAVNGIYKNISDNAQYITIESTMTRGTALEVIETIIENAEKIARPIDPVIAGLEVILRDNEKNRGSQKPS